MKDRTADMIEMYTVKGLTLEAIGGEYGITRQRVQQILSKEGVRASEGGATLSSELKRKELQLKKYVARNKYIKQHYGCTLEEYNEINQGLPWYNSPVMVFRTIRGNVGKHGVGWRLSLTEWWKIWQDSGKWNQRGHTGDSYVMGRKSWKRPYTVKNTIVLTLRKVLSK